VLVIHVIVHLLACSVNPADIGVISKMRQGTYKTAQFDRTLHQHVIENFHCYICEVDVLVTLLFIQIFKSCEVHIIIIIYYLLFNSDDKVHIYELQYKDYK